MNKKNSTSTPTRSEVISAAKSLLPALRDRAEETEDLRSLPNRTIEDLKNVDKKDEILTPQQIVGLKYFEDLSQRIPRKEMKLWEQMVNRITKKLSKKTDDILISELAGSFRRKKSSSGDIDI